MKVCVCGGVIYKDTCTCVCDASRRCIERQPFFNPSPPALCFPLSGKLDSQPPLARLHMGGVGVGDHATSSDRKRHKRSATSGRERRVPRTRSPMSNLALKDCGCWASGVGGARANGAGAMEDE